LRLIRFSFMCTAALAVGGMVSLWPYHAPRALAAPQPPAAPPASPPAAKKLSGYEIEEATSLNGKYKVTVVDNAVRVEHYNYGYIVVSKAPTWDVYLYRPDTKEYAQTPYKAWLKTNLVLLTTLWTMELKKPEDEKRFVQAGKPYVRYLFPNTEVLSGFYRNTDRDEFKDMVNNKGEILCLDYPKDIHPGGVSGRVMALPELQGIALHAMRKSAKVVSWSLKNSYHKKRDDISPALFDLPPGFKKVPFGRHLFSSATERDTINDFLGGPGEK